MLNNYAESSPTHNIDSSKTIYSIWIKTRMVRAWEQVMMTTRMTTELCLVLKGILWMMGSGIGGLMIEIKDSNGITSKMQNTTFGRLQAIVKISPNPYPSTGMTCFSPRACKRIP